MVPRSVVLHADHKHNRICNLPWLVTSGPQELLCPSQWPRNSTISRCLTSQLGNMAKNQNQTGQSSPGRVILAICLLEASQHDTPKEWSKATRKQESRAKQGRLQNLDGGRNDRTECSKWNRSQIRLILLPLLWPLMKLEILFSSRQKASHPLS